MANGPYATATVTTFPTGSPASCPVASSVAITFNVIEPTEVGETVYLSGSISQLGSWNPAQAVELSPQHYGGSNTVWFGIVVLPVGTSFQYKYLKTEPSGSVIFENGSNRVYTVPTGSTGVANENDNWQN